jgi:hypothetical protein
MQRRLFTLEEANQLVPWLERTFRSLESSMERLQTLQGRLSALEREQRRQNGTFDRYNEVNLMQAELNDLGGQLQSAVDEINAEGITVRDVGQGLVDFPHMREGREVYLCWIKGEARIDYWHETDRGFAHRQPL